MKRINSAGDMAAIVEKYGFLPFFQSGIPGFSVEEMASPSVWFPPKGEGVWEWKDPVMRMTGCAYGKFFRSHPGFISSELFPVLAAYRRDGYDMEGMINDGLMSHGERVVYSILEETESESSTFLRLKSKMAKSSFEKAVSDLQMRTFVMVSGFEYSLTKDGRPYGWGKARYALPETVYPGFEESIDRYTPEEAHKILMERMKKNFPDAEEALIQRFIG